MARAGRVLRGALACWGSGFTDNVPSEACPPLTRPRWPLRPQRPRFVRTRARPRGGEEDRLRTRSVMLVAALAWATPAGAKKAARSAPAVDPGSLFLEPTPAATAQLRIQDPGQPARTAPARVKLSAGKPLRIEIEDLDQAEYVEICIEAEAPATFCAAADSTGDTGTLRREGNRLHVKLDRGLPAGGQRHLELSLDTAPAPIAHPSDWLKQGTVLYFGRAFDEKPVTKVVPMALNVRMAEASDGSRVFTWRADLDPERETDALSARTVSGRRIVKPEVVASGTRHSDAFSRGDDVPEELGSLFLSAATFAQLKKYQGAPFEDAEVPGGGVLVKTGEINVVVQANDQLWMVPAVVATLAGGAGVYVIADDPAAPLILSASRPGQQIRLMAIAAP
jgi:hypothetical protein